MDSNPQIDLAYRFVSRTNKNIYLTGKAGTGKTTFLKRVRREIPKRMAVVAPTGVAAINAEGMTIHSLFQLPFGPIVPGKPMKERRKFSKQKIKLLKGLELLVIDEISMVRADVLDAIDMVLKRYKQSNLPFGGVQLLLIGDLHQLPPVVRNEEWSLLSPHFNTPYFFGSNALKASQPITIQLQKIYRQDDSEFIDLLNQVRDNQISDKLMNKLNSRYRGNVSSYQDQGYVTLSSHNASADKINLKRLNELKADEHTFTAEVHGNFPENTYPTEELLTLKEGAQVMFVKNDTSEEKRFFNGKLGTVKEIDSDHVIVEDQEGIEIAVEPARWENIRYSLDDKTKEVDEETIGSFEQIPLKLAWAITIHKSQGLTFDKLIIDAQAAFAHGQVYVALSRCTNFEGIILSSRLQPSSVKTDVEVSHFSRTAEANQPNEDHLFKAQKTYQEQLLTDLFGFESLSRISNRLMHRIHGGKNSLPEHTVKESDAINAFINDKIIKVGKGFQRELLSNFSDKELPEESETIQERLKKSSQYFRDQLKTLEQNWFDLDTTTDNSRLESKLNELNDDFDQEMASLNAAFKLLSERFDSDKYIREQANIAIDHVPDTRKKKKRNIPKDVINESLFQKLVHWRREKAKEIGKPAFVIFHTKVLIELSNFVPESGKEMMLVPGIGKAKAEKYGTELMVFFDMYRDNPKIFDGYLEENQQPDSEKKKKKKKGETYRISFEMYKDGMSVEEIAKERGLVDRTIHGHLARFVGQKEIDIKDVMAANDAQEIVKYFTSAGDDTLNAAKEHFGEKYDYYELNYAREFWRGVVQND